jgi:hypothetical protein
MVAVVCSQTCHFAKLKGSVVGFAHKNSILPSSRPPHLSTTHTTNTGTAQLFAFLAEEGSDHAQGTFASKMLSCF